MSLDLYTKAKSSYHTSLPSSASTPLPDVTTLKKYSEHYRKHAKLGTITKKQAEDIIDQLEKIKNVMKQLKMEKDEKTKALISVSKGFDSARQVVTILSKEREILKQKITNLSNLLNEQKEQENG